MSRLSTTQQDGFDFVLLWVDGNDPKWQSEFSKYSLQIEGDKRKCRFRDWGNLKYLFRAFEQCTPWVRKVHFVTWGHLPPWLNTKHNKINIVRHEDFLPKEQLPVFNSHPLEINLHRIPDLSEYFVYFNDDTFLLKPISKEYFFNKGLPKDMCVFNTIFLDSISHIRLNVIEIINKHFLKSAFIKKNFFKIFHHTYGYHQLRSLFLLPWPQITGFYDPHQPQPFLKRTFEDVWNHNEEILRKTSFSRFRDNSDVNQYFFRYWQLLKGNFVPRSFSDTTTIPVRSYIDIEKASSLIKRKKYTMLCVNDELGCLDDTVFNLYKDTINNAFDVVFPNKSTFEL